MGLSSYVELRLLPRQARVRGIAATETTTLNYIQSRGRDMVADRNKTEVKTFQQQILEAEQKIEKAISQLFDRDAILKKVCEEIQSQMGFDFAGISLVFPEKDTIEAVQGTGIAAKWAGGVKHYLAKDPDLRDIQADIVQTCRTEIISGWDKRFDDGIYDEYRHEDLVRVLTPILLIRDQSGKVSEDWFEYCQWEVLREEKKEEGQHAVIEMRLPEEVDIEVIGTLETGYKDSKKSIKAAQAIALAKLLGKQALKIRQGLLLHVLEIIVDQARDIVGAESATLHFLWDLEQNRYIYEVSSASVSQHLLKGCWPRKEGLRQQAIREARPKFIPDPFQDDDQLTLKDLNPIVFEAGFKAMAAFPLIDQQEGVLSIYFQTEHQFTKNEISWVELFANRVVGVIRQVRTYEQMGERTRQLAALHSVAQSLSQVPEKGHLLRLIAGKTLNILAADVVSIFEYTQTEKIFLPEPYIAGRLKAKPEMDTNITKHETPDLLVKHQKNIYAARVVEEAIFKNSSFTKRESIESTAAVLLRVDEETVGVMFISYRRHHCFSDEEKQFIETLASSAASALKNQQWLQTLSDIDRDIITTLDQEKLLNLIMQQAVQITAADLGLLYLLNPISQELLVKTDYPKNLPLDEKFKQIKMQEGITGWVATRRESKLVNDVQADQHYKRCFANVRSELCVPLLDKDRYVLGVLNVESYQAGAFDLRHQKMLEALANQAVIAIQNVETKEKLVATEKVATLSEMASTLMHRMNNSIGAIRVWSQDILDEDIQSSKTIAKDILSKADEILNDIKRLGSWGDVQLQPVELHKTFDLAVTKVSLPPHITTKINIPNDLPKVSAGKSQLRDVFYNLLQNAIEAMPNGGTLSVDSKTVELEGRCWVELIVRDNGVGIAEDNQEQIFQADYSTKSTNRVMRGFGLWWTQAYVQRLGGWLKVESKLGKGAHFTVILPAN
ncbi:MAG: GAF domain-containing protein [Symploca sp. SIO2C1]|nr:GAF domain-containing protein [Symploca sp. SIO2C1]